jgi:hypothetical protein
MGDLFPRRGGERAEKEGDEHDRSSDETGVDGRPKRPGQAAHEGDTGRHAVHERGQAGTQAMAPHGQAYGFLTGRGARGLE